MRSKINSIRLFLVIAAGLAAAVSSHAQSATATLAWVAAGDSYDYTITLHNTGTVALNGFWYGWTTGGDNLPSAPSSPGNSSGWGNVVSGNSIQWMNNTYVYYGYTYYYGTPLAPGASATFTFVSSTPPSAITNSPSGASVAYVDAINLTENKPGNSSPVFSPTPATPPPAVPTATATISGLPSGSSYDYTITLQNTGAVALNSFWYGWTTGGDNLPSDPSATANSLGWSNDLSGNSIQWINSSGTALAPGASATFTFVSSDSPSAITTSPSGESVAYVGGIDFTQDKAGDSTAVFSPSLTNPPPAVPTVTATISGVPDGSSYDYTITLQNTGAVALNSFWYGWTTGGNNLPSDPSAAANSLGWSNDLSGNSIKWTNSSGTALAPGASATFTFVSSDSPSAITTSPSGESVAYVGGIDFTQGTAGDSSAVFSPTLTTPPPVVPTVSATISGVLAGSSYDYTITLQNTGTVALNSLWYGWTIGGNNLPSIPSTAANSLGWSNDLSGNSIKWTNSSGAALAPGASATFTFVSSDSPSAITTSPSGESVAYVADIDFTQDQAGDSSDVFSPILVSGPPALTMTLNPAGLGSGSSNWLVLSWPTNMPGLTLQSSTNLASPSGWASNSVPPVVVNGQYTVTNIISGAQSFSAWPLPERTEITGHSSFAEDTPPSPKGVLPKSDFAFGVNG